MDQEMERIVTAVVQRISVELEASGRHVHLTSEDVAALFGPSHKLTPVKALSQPGQYACRERVTVEGPKGSLSNVVVLGPERRETQVEVSRTDCVALGITAPVRLSGQVRGTPGVTLRAGERTVVLNQGLMVAQRHLHMTPADAQRFGVEDGQRVSLKTLTERPVRFDEVLVRVSDQSATVAHLDYDEANACGFRPNDRGVILP